MNLTHLLVSSDNGNSLTDSSKLVRQHRLNKEEEQETTNKAATSTTTEAMEQLEGTTSISILDAVYEDASVRNISDSRGVFSSVINNIKKGQQFSFQFKLWSFEIGARAGAWNRVKIDFRKSPLRWSLSQKNQQRNN